VNRQEFAVSEVIDDSHLVGRVQLLACAHIDQEFLLAIVEAGLLEPIGASIEHWQFAGRDLRRARAAHRLVSDLDVNVSGAALIVELLETRNELLSRVAMLERALDGR